MEKGTREGQDYGCAQLFQSGQERLLIRNLVTWGIKQKSRCQRPPSKAGFCHCSKPYRTRPHGSRHYMLRLQGFEKYSWHQSSFLLAGLQSATRAEKSSKLSPRVHFACYTLIHYTKYAH